MVRDSVADALIRIKNGYMAKRVQVSLPYSKLITSILNVLKKAGYIENFKEQKNNRAINALIVNLKYDNERGSATNKKPALTEVKRVSKPGLRVYKGTTKLPRVLNGLGIAIISTPKGVMSDKDARKEKLGGEVMALVW